MAATGWRVALISTVAPIAEMLAHELGRLGHEPVAVIGARRALPGDPGPFALTEHTAPAGLDVSFARDKWSMEPLLRAARPDLAICWAFPWRIPLPALQVPKLGSINLHPAMLPRHRGPIPLSWALRAGDTQYGATWHRMDADLDTGGILAQAPVPIQDDDFEIAVVGQRIAQVALALLPRALERVGRGDPGDPQSAEGVTWAGHFREDYATIDWSQPARAIHDQVRAWSFVSVRSDVIGPVAEIDGRRVRVARTTIHDPGAADGARRMDTGDGPIWILATEPLEPSQG